MAKKLIKNYRFSPGATPSGYAVIPGKWDLSHILLITNITRGVILFNFADTANTGATITFKPGGQPTNTGDTSVVTYGSTYLEDSKVDGTAAIQNTITGMGETYVYFTGVDTSSYSANDKISIFVEENYVYTRPWSDFGTDAIERARVAGPVAQIDADFEYGLQGTKWQSVELIGQYPSVYEVAGLDLTASGNANVTIQTSIVSGSPTLIQVNSYPIVHNLKANDPFTVQQLNPVITGYDRAQGSSLVYANVDIYNWTYYSKYNRVANVGDTAGTTIHSPRTLIRKGGFFSGASLPVNFVESDGASPSLIKVTTNTPHGFTPGMPVLIAADSTYNTNQLQYLPGAYNANAITSATTFTFYARGVIAAANVLPSSSTNKISLYARPDGFFVHRPGDGGVILGTGSPVHGASAQRQSKKYFRYQSGKGLLYTTGVLFAPNYNITAIGTAGGTISGTTITISTDVPHGLQAGAVIRVVGVATSGYDNQYTVDTVLDSLRITVFAAPPGGSLGSSSGAVTAVPKMFVYQWTGSAIRTGPHDDANGMFWEYDGQYFNVVKRTSTLQLAGTATFTPNSNNITGVATKWTQQLKIGDRVVIKGMVHKIAYITSDTNISVSPDYRGAFTTAGNYIWKVQENRVTQSDFNMDTADGSSGIANPSGFKMDPNFMQMVGIQFTWYGAGFMDFMVRGHDANFIICHRLKQNNINITASMRTANLPVRYEVINESSQGIVTLKSSMNSSSTDPINVDIVDFLPSSGYVYIDYELIRYTGVSRSSTPWPQLTGLTRSAAMPQFVGEESGALTNFYGAPATTHSIGAGIELVAVTATPTMSHWGSSYIMDGGFDFDRGYSFSYTASGVSVGSNVTALFGIRLSPSASNGITGDLGARELLNRAQLLLEGIDVISPPGFDSTANSSIVVTGILNPGNYYDATSWTPLNSQLLGNQPSFTQVDIAPTFTGGYDSGYAQVGVQGWGQEAIPGEKIFEFTTALNSAAKLDLTGIKELTQSAVGGRGTFPNGPDTLYINIGINPNTLANTAIVGNVSVTLRWAEAQA